MTTKNELEQLIAEPEKLIAFIISLIGEDYEGPVGLRGLYENEGIGKLRKSYDWEDGNMLDEKLEGTCIVGLSSNWNDAGYQDLESSIKKFASEAIKYGDGKVGLVIGKGYPDLGNDFWSNEMIFEKAKVIYIWE